MTRSPFRRIFAASAALALTLVFVGAAIAADFVWSTETITATRFAEADSAPVGEVEVGQRVEVLATAGDRVRVRVEGSTFGWIDAAKTTDTDPSGGAPDDGADPAE